MLNPKATKEPVENEDGFWDDGFPVNTCRSRLELIVAEVNKNIAKALPRKRATRDDFGLNPVDGSGLMLRRKRMGSTFDFTKHYIAEFGQYGGLVMIVEDGWPHNPVERWIVFIKDLFGAIYAFCEYTSFSDLNAVWELD